MWRLPMPWVLALAVLAGEARAADLASWEKAVAEQCPSHHLERMCDGCYDDFLDGFERTLPKATQSRILKIADYSRRCREEVGGLSCEMSVHVDAMKRLGLLKRFVAYGCAEYTCPDPAHCDRTKTGSPTH